MPLLRCLFLVSFLASCTGGSDTGDDFYSCESGESISHSCIQFGEVCIDETATCVGGQWQCPEGFEYYGEPCRPDVTPDAGPIDDSLDRDCSDYGGGQAILAQRCNEDIVEYCIYSDTTQTATWSEIQSCTAPQRCEVEGDMASCQDASDPQL